MKQVLAGMILGMTILCLFSSAQQDATVAANAVVPTLVKFSGTLSDLNGQPLTGVIGVTFMLYKDERGGAALWMETQNITPEKAGHYTVVLGSTSAQGLPADLFASGEARWLAVQAQGQAEQPRVLLLSVPYALKAGDAQTLGGLPASAFMLAAPVGSNNATAAGEAATAAPTTGASSMATSDVTTTGGTVNAIPLFTTATNVQNSILTQTGPAINVAGKLNLPATGTAISTAGKNSQPQTFAASVFNSGTSTAVPQTFQLQAEPVGNDTSTAAGTLNLLYGSGTATPTETGLRISSKGLIAFAAGQTFPGAGTITGIATAAGSGLTGGGATGTLNLKLLSTCTTNQILKWTGTAWACAADANSGGTVTSVASGAGLTGGPITGTGTLSIASGGVSNAMLAHDSVTVTPGTDLTGGGAVALGGTTTLNLDTTKVPTLAATTNTFAGAINAVNLSITGEGYFGAYVATANNVFADWNGTNSGNYYPGYMFGGASYASLTSKQTAGGNQYGLDFWTNFSDQMSITQSGNVGLGTTQPYTQLHLVKGASGTLGPTLTLMNNGGGAGSAASVDFDGYDTTTNSPTVRIESIDDGNSSSSLSFQTKVPGAATNGLVEQVRISDYGSLVVDSSGNNTGFIGSGAAAGTGIEFGGTGSGEGIASSRSTVYNQYGLDLYTGWTSRLSIANNGYVSVGYGMTVVNGSGTALLVGGNADVTGCLVAGGSNLGGGCSSDLALKRNVQPFPSVLEKLAQLQPVHFNWRDTNPVGYPSDPTRQTGLIAQQVEKVFPELVSVDQKGYRRVDYGQLPYLLLQGVRELKESNDKLHAEAQHQRQQAEKARFEIAKLRKAAAATEARLARLDRAAAAKDVQIVLMSREIEQLRQTQERMSALLARVAPPDTAKEKQAEAYPAVKPRTAQKRELASAKF